MTYDEMILRGPDEPNEVGTEDGDVCGRLPPPDEDEPRGYKRKPCNGEMRYHKDTICTCHESNPCRDCMAEPLTCDTCGEEA